MELNIFLGIFETKLIWDYYNIINPKPFWLVKQIQVIYQIQKTRSQTGCLFNNGDTNISWRSVKQSLVATSSNHAEILVIYETSRECVWLRSICQHIHESCGLPYDWTIPTILFEDNTTYIEQLRRGYIIRDKTKHISSKFFFTHDLQDNGEIEIRQIRSSDNLADLQSHCPQQFLTRWYILLKCGDSRI